MRRSHRERGQTLPETALFIPLVLLALFGTMYLSQLSVVAARTHMGIRYAAQVGLYNGASTLYDVKQIYATAAAPALFGSCPTPNAAIMWDGAPLPGPTSVPYWQPSGTSTGCTPAASRLGGAQFLASHFFATANESLTATLNLPTYENYLSATVGAATTKTATEKFVHPADPDTILYCSQEVDKRVYNAIAVSVAPAPSPSPSINPSPSPLAFSC